MEKQSRSAWRPDIQCYAEPPRSLPIFARLLYSFAMLCRLALALLLLAPLPARADGFVAGTEDVPLMPGLAPVAGSALTFDKPEGRIVEAQASGKVTRAAVHRFYAESLPQ